ncbi:MFS transporter [Paenibacillus algorifonticola]|uniref:MFS transporter n=1 Tax=Paenibacillus algorifonticola TaxID=684063 RepID=UPI003D2B806E
MNEQLSTRQIGLWRNAIYVIFTLVGFATASWISRTPAIRDTLGASTGQMGWIIFGLSVGSILGLLGAGLFVASKGGRFVMMNGLLIAAGGLAIIGVGSSLFTYAPVVFIGLAFFGFGCGICDVAMNVEGTMLERATKKSLLTGFHAAFSLGTFIGAVVGWLAAKSHISVGMHLSIVLILMVVLIVYLSRFVPKGTGQESKTDETAPTLSTKDRLAIWKEPRTLLLGIIILGMTFAEGSANDWLPLIMVDGYDTSATTGSFVYGVFVAAMTIVRATGGILLDKFGRVAMLRASAISAIAGLLIVILGHNYIIASIGVVLWGFGAAFGFPVALSAAGDNPNGVAVRVGAVATAGYLAFLVGPPLLGMIGDSIGLRMALIVVLVGMVFAGLTSHAARPLGEKGQAKTK